MSLHGLAKKRGECRIEMSEHFLSCGVCKEALKTIAAFASLCYEGRRLHRRQQSITAMMAEEMRLHPPKPREKKPHRPRPNPRQMEMPLNLLENPEQLD